MPESSSGASRQNLPPLECLRYFEIAARHESFVRAARELGVTPAAVAYRIKVLEDHLGRNLFDRQRRSVTLNDVGRACLRDVQPVLAEIGQIGLRYGANRSARRLSVAAEESLADRWLMPKLPAFRAAEPDLAIEIETDLANTDPQNPDVDLWITYAGEPRAPAAPEARHETLFEVTAFPVCSPALLESRPRPGRAAELHGWPLLYHMGRPSDWQQWFAAHGTMAPNLADASGFRLGSMVVRAALHGMGAALGSEATVGRELRRGSLAPLFGRDSGPRTGVSLVTTAAARARPEVRAFADWIRGEAAAHREARGGGQAGTRPAVR